MTILKARKRPTEVFCVRYTGDNMEELRDFTDGMVLSPDEGVYLTYDDEPAEPIAVGDYIIQDAPKKWHVCKPDEFARTYEEPEEYNPTSIFYEFETLNQKQLINFVKRMEERRQAKMAANNGMTTLGDHMVVSVFEKVANNECKITGLSKQNKDPNGNGKLWIELTFYYGKDSKKDSDDTEEEGEDE